MKISRSSQGATRKILVVPLTLNGTPAVTTRGFGEAECAELAGWIADVLDAPTDEAALAKVREQVSALCKKFPVYGQ